MNKAIVLLVSISFFLLTSCERVATVDIPQTDPLPVMYAFLSPEDMGSSVSITMSQPIFNSNSNGIFEEVKTAQVTISDNNGGSKLMPFNTTKKAYYLVQSEFPINPGMTYTIEAKFSGFSLKATTTVPTAVVPFDEVISEVLPQDPNGADRYLLRMKWHDELGITNYYRVNVEELNSFNPGDTTAYSIGDKMFNDVGKDGAIISDKFEYYSYNFGGTDPSFNAYLFNTDSHYYEYHKRRLNYFGDDPFSEPVQQYSNVKGGLGVVCSFRKTKTRVTL